jgi:hypothetical protein
MRLIFIETSKKHANVKKNKEMKKLKPQIKQSDIQNVKKPDNEKCDIL